MTSIASSLASTTATQVRITNLVIAAANAEVAHTLITGCKYLEITSRNNRTVTKCAFIATQSGTNYKTIKRGNAWWLAGMSFTGKTLYVQCDQTDTLEIVELY